MIRTELAADKVSITGTCETAFNQTSDVMEGLRFDHLVDCWTNLLVDTIQNVAWSFLMFRNAQSLMHVQADVFQKYILYVKHH